MDRKSLLLLLAALALLGAVLPQPSPNTWIIPGGGLNDILAEIFTQAQDLIAETQIDILIVPITLIRDGAQTPQRARQELENEAEALLVQAQAACEQVFATHGKSCAVEVLPIYSREEAQDNLLVDRLLDAKIDFILLPEGTPSSTVSILKDTLLELGLGGALSQGSLLVGFGEEAGQYWLRSHADIENPFRFGAVTRNLPVEEWGLNFALQNNLVETHFFAFDRLAYLLNGITLPEGPHLALGIDTQAAVFITDNIRLSKVVGESYAILLDAETYHAASQTRYLGEEHLLSTRNVLVHLMQRGEYDYDFNRRAWGNLPTPNKLSRDFQSLILPKSAGALFLTHSLSTSPQRALLLTDFINTSGGENASLLIIASGYASESQALEIIAQLTADIPVHYETIAPPQLDLLTVEQIEAYSGIILSMGPASWPTSNALNLIRTAWVNGANLILDGYAPVFAGTAYFAPTQIHPTSMFDETPLPGFGLIDACISRVPEEQAYWLEFFSLAYHCPSLSAIRLTPGAMLKFSSSVPQNVGDNSIPILDLRHAQIRPAAYVGMVFAYGLLDVLAPGEAIENQIADVARAPIPFPTPIIVLPTSTDTPTVVETQFSPTALIELSPSPTVTPTPRRRRLTPTPTPMEFLGEETPLPPPPVDPILKQSMILVAAIIVAIVLLGVVINYRLLRR